VNAPTMTRRGLGLVVALLLALLATAAMVSYVRSASRRAAGAGSSVAVFIAKDTIPAGTPVHTAVQRGLIVGTKVPQRLVADGAVRSLDEVRGRFAAVTILRGEQIVGSRFTGQIETPRLLPIPADRQAISVEVNAPPGVGGFVQPHDHVSVIAKIDVGGGPRVQFILQDIEVLAVGQRSVQPASGGREATRTQSQTQAQPQDKVLLTLATTPAQSEQLAFAVLQGDVYFALLPAGQKPALTPGRTAQSEFR